jgi:hypothetical protein
MSSNQKYGSIKFLQNTKGELKKIQEEPWAQSETIIIKPNWVSTEPGGFTCKNTIQKIVEALDSKIIVTEAHCLARAMNLEKQGLPFTIENKEVNWNWLLKGKGWNWLYDNPSWDWFIKEGHWNHLRKEEQYFLDTYGFTDLFQDYDIEYVNVTDEIWQGKNVNSDVIRNLTESKYSPVKVERMYGFVPSKLYQYTGNTFVSLNRLKQYATFSLKNMFGLIPDPLRSWWHGRNVSRLASSIVDINKIYNSIFDVVGFCASIDKTAVRDPDGEFVADYMSARYRLVDGFDFVVMGSDLVFLDSTMLSLTGDISDSVKSHNVDPVELAEKEGLGLFNREKSSLVKLKLGKWISKNR